jgi:hypothetical protein
MEIVVNGLEGRRMDSFYPVHLDEVGPVRKDRLWFRAYNSYVHCVEGS